MSCPYGHKIEWDDCNDDCGYECDKCGVCFCFNVDNYECWLNNKYYCMDCISDVVKEDTIHMTLDEMCNDYEELGNEYIYAWLYETDEYHIEESVATIESWWFNQRKKMFRKPTKSAQKK